MESRISTPIVLPAVFLTICALTVPALGGSCRFPSKWQGSWFESGERYPVVIKGSTFSTKGWCYESDGDKFVIGYQRDSCYRCVVIQEKHPNVLQYRETFCHDRESLSTLCNFIGEKSVSYYMFRENAAPVPCPFSGRFTFTYNRGNGECRTPVSTIDTCLEDSKLLLSYQACPDVQSSESTEDELQCLAYWRDGNSSYLVGKVYHDDSTWNEDLFRCFLYEKAPTPRTKSLKNSSNTENLIVGEAGISDFDYRITQSGDATCHGLINATKGSRTLVLKKAPPQDKCSFPSWVASHNHWYTSDRKVNYKFHHRDGILRITNISRDEIQVSCNQLKTTEENSTILLAQFKVGCRSEFRCMSFDRKNEEIIEVQIGNQTKRQEDACNPDHFNRTSLPHVTLFRHRYETVSACENTTLNIDCEDDEVIKLIYANYGRFSITVCNDEGNTDWSVICRSPKSSRVLHTRCHGRNNCTVDVNNETFGDPCPGTKKYIQADYYCEQAQFS